MPLGVHIPPAHPASLPAAIHLSTLLVCIGVYQHFRQRCRHSALPLALRTQAWAYAYVEVWQRAAWRSAHPALSIREPCFCCHVPTGCIFPLDHCPQVGRCFLIQHFLLDCHLSSHRSLYSLQLPPPPLLRATPLRAGRLPAGRPRGELRLPPPPPPPPSLNSTRSGPSPCDTCKELQTKVN